MTEVLVRLKIFRSARARRPGAMRRYSTAVEYVHDEHPELQLGRFLYPETPPDPPRSRDECRGGPRPCPYVRCRYNLYLDVIDQLDRSPKRLSMPEGTRAIRFNAPHAEPWDVEHSCALDLADAGDPLTLDEVGRILGLTRERVRQIESRALAKLQEAIAKLPAVAGDLAAS